MGTTKENLRVRASPSTSATILDQLNKGDAVEVVGRTAASDWLQIPVPSKPNTLGWVSAQFVTVSGSLDMIPVVQPGAPGAKPTSQPPVQPPGQPPAQPPGQPYPPLQTPQSYPRP